MTTKSHAGAAAKKDGSVTVGPFRVDGIARAPLPHANDNSQVRGLKPSLPTYSRGAA